MVEANDQTSHPAPLELFQPDTAPTGPDQLSEAHGHELASLHAVPAERARFWGFRSTPTGIEIPWSDGTRRLSILRTDKDKRTPDTPKYTWPSGQTTILNRRRDNGSPAVLIVEGTLQHHAAAAWAPEELDVFGMSGCDGIHEKTDLQWAKGRTVYLCFDKDRTTNPGVAAAAGRVRDRLSAAGAKRVLLVDYPGSGTEGLDDVLARLPEQNRTPCLREWVTAATEARGELSPDGRTRRNTSSAAGCADWLRDELGRGHLSGLFLREGALVHTPRIGEAGYIEPPEHETGRGIHPGPAQIRPVEIPHVKALVEHVYDCGRNEERETQDKEGNPVKKKQWRSTLFPKAAVDSAVHRAVLGYAPHLRHLRGITHTPVLRPDGTILETPGYDEQTGLLYLPEPGLTVPGVPDQPTPEQIGAAVRLILRPVEQFPFVREDHRAAWVGLMLTPLMRPVLPPPYQFGVITATNPGSGKTLLADLIGIVHGATKRGELPRDQDELRKAVTSTLVDTTAPVAIFDNMTGVVRSSVLEALLTSAEYTDRLLGKNRNLSLTNDRLWVATGNNVRIGGDLARRCVFISLDPAVERPHMRTGFAIPDLEAWMRGNRGEYLAALLTLARGWSLAGAPEEGDRSDSFAKWSGSLRGLLKWAGFPGEFGAPDDEGQHGDSEDDEEWGGFLAEIYDARGAEPFTAKSLLESVKAGDVQADTLPGDLAREWDSVQKSLHAASAGLTKKLGHWFSYRVGRYAAGFKVVDAGGSAKRGKKYAVQAPSGYVRESRLPVQATAAAPARPTVSPGVNPFG